MGGIIGRVAAVLLGIAATGCTILKDGSVSFSGGYDPYKQDPWYLTAPGSLKTGGNAFLKFQNKKGGAGAYGFVTSPFDLWAPFRWEARGGKIDPKSPGSGTGFFCTELDVRGSSPLEFYALCARSDPGGFTCWVAKRGTSVVAQVFLTGTEMVDMAVEHTGTDLVFSVRRPTDLSWTTITTIAQSPTAAIVPSVGFAQVPAGAQADFDDMRIVSNGPLPVGATEGQVLARIVMDAGMPVADAARAIDGAGPDLGSAAVLLENAITALTAAETSVADGAAGLPDPRTGAKAAKWVRAARKSVEKAGKAFEKGKPHKPVSTALLKALAEIYDAVQALDPHTLPGG